MSFEPVTVYFADLVAAQGKALDQAYAREKELQLSLTESQSQIEDLRQRLQDTQSNMRYYQRAHHSLGPYAKWLEDRVHFPTGRTIPASFLRHTYRHGCAGGAIITVGGESFITSDGWRWSPYMDLTKDEDYRLNDSGSETEMEEV